MCNQTPDWTLATDDTLGGRMSLARDACGLSAEDAALLVAVSKQMWLAWENDRDEPDPAYLEEIADSLHISLAWLVSGRGIGPIWRNSEPSVAMSETL